MRRTTRLTAERGSISVVAAGIMALVLVVAVLCADVAKALMTASRAQTAADAAALAAAQSLVAPGGGDPKEAASAYAAANGGKVIRCECAAGGSEVTVSVAVGMGSLLLLPGDREVVRAARAVVGSPDG